VNTRIRDRLTDGGTAIVVAPFATSAGLVELLGHMDFDGVFLDGEHGPPGREDIGHMVRAAELAGHSSGEDRDTALRRQPVARWPRVDANKARDLHRPWLGPFQTRTRRRAVSIQRKPSVNARERFIREVKLWLKANLLQTVRGQQAHLRTMLLGFDLYFGVCYCTRALRGVLDRVENCWQRALPWRSQNGPRHTD
jgi:hypothetical protein